MPRTVPTRLKDEMPITLSSAEITRPLDFDLTCCDSRSASESRAACRPPLRSVLPAPVSASSSARSSASCVRDSRDRRARFRCVHTADRDRADPQARRSRSRYRTTHKAPPRQRARDLVADTQLLAKRRGGTSTGALEGTSMRMILSGRRCMQLMILVPRSGRWLDRSLSITLLHTIGETSPRQIGSQTRHLMHDRSEGYYSGHGCFGSALQILYRRRLIVEQLAICKLYRKRWHNIIPDGNCWSCTV